MCLFVCVCVCLCARLCLSSAAAAAERELRCPSPAAWHLLVKLACYKGSLTMALCMCEKDNATDVAWQPLEQDWLNSVRNIRGAAQKN